MKWDSEAIISGALSGFLSGAGAIIAVSLSNTTLLINIPIIIILPLLGAIFGVLTGKYIWKKREKYPGVVYFKKLKTKKRLPGEVFMAELLQNPILMNKKIIGFQFLLTEAKFKSWSFPIKEKKNYRKSI